MNRLTLPHWGGKGHYMKCSEQFGCSGDCADCEELDKIVEKLAEYENKEEEKPQTNADRIRSMTDEEMATDLLDMFEEICEDGVPCKEWMLSWLKQPNSFDDRSIV